MTTLLVTTGATWTFPRLIDSTLSPLFIKRIIELGYSKIIVQYGAENPRSQDIFFASLSELFARHGKPVPSKDSILVKRLKGSEQNSLVKYVIPQDGIGIEIVGVNYDPNFTQNYTEKVDLVISHAGTGSILDTLRLNKKLIVMVNDELADNHQAEIAEAFEELGVLKYTDGKDIHELINLVKLVSTGKQETLKKANGRIIENIIIDELFT